MHSVESHSNTQEKHTAKPAQGNLGRSPQRTRRKGQTAHNNAYQSTHGGNTCTSFTIAACSAHSAGSFLLDTYHHAVEGKKKRPEEKELRQAFALKKPFHNNGNSQRR